MERRCEQGKIDAENSRGNWNRAYYAVGIPAALFAGLAGAASVSGQTNAWVRFLGVLGLIGSGLAAVATSLNAGRRVEAEMSKAASYDALRLEMTVTRKLDLPTWTDGNEARDSVEDYLRRLNDLAGVSDQPSFYSRHRPGAGEQLGPPR
jgi:hypothetical protein